MIISRYISKEILLTLLGVTFVLLLAFLSQQVVRYLNYAAIGKIPVDVLFELVSFEIPYLLALLLPLGLYLAMLLSYGRLYAEREMSILQLAGFGNKKLLRLTLQLGLFIAFFVLFLMLWVNPWISEKRQKVMASDEATLHLIQTLLPGRFQVSPDGRHVMYVEKLSRDHKRAENVFLAQEKQNKNNESHSDWMLVLAKQGYQIKDNETQDQFFVTRGGYRYEGTPGQNDYKIIRFNKYAVRIPQKEVRISHLENETLPLQTLWHDYGDPKRAGELQWRFSIAISALMLALLAVPISSVKPRKSRYWALIPAIIFYITYINLLFISRHWVEIGRVSIAVGMWWVHAAIFMIFLLLYYLHARREG